MGKPKTTYPMAVFDSWQTPKLNYNNWAN
jgi:hypothetical protein